MLQIKKQYIYVIILILFLYSTFLVGRLGYIYELNRSKPPILQIPEINPKVCRISISEFNNNKIVGKTSELDTRFSFKDKIFFVKDGNFEIVK
ncbi:MAG: hypothetical protein WC755_06935 [Candidatus Woesearchaeota archaeon]|jgi:hypothetical protein